MVKRFLCIVTVAMLLLSSCGQPVDNTAEQQGSASSLDTAADASPAGSGSEGEDPRMTPLGKYPDMITMTISKVMITNPHLIEGQSPEDNIMLDWIRDNLNIDIKIAWQAEASEYNNKLALNVASGDLPDMITILGNHYLTFRQMVDNDLLADISDEYEKCAGDYLRKTYDSFQGNNLEPLRVDGGLYAITSANIGYGHNLLWLRKDWMELLNLDAPKSVEDLEQILSAFVEQDPGGNGAGNTVGLTLHATKPVFGYGNKFGAEPVFHSVGAYPWQWMKGDDGTISYGSVQPEMKAGLAILRDWYEKGLIDKQFLTRTGAGETDAVVDSGLSGAFFGPWWAVSGDVYTNNPDVSFLAVNAPLDSAGKYNHLTPVPTGDLLAVNADFAYPEAMLKVVNLEYDMYRGINVEGLAAIQPVFDQGVSREAIFPTGGFNLDYFDVVPKLGRMVKTLVETGVMDDDENTTDYDRWKAEGAARFASGASKGLDSEVNDFRDYYGRYVGSNILDTPENHPIYAAYSYTTESSSNLRPTLDKLEEQMYLQIITGEKPLDYFDEFVAQWNKLGGETLRGEVQAIVG